MQMLEKGQVVPGRMDEFAFVLLAGIILIGVLMISFTTTPEELPPIVTPTDVFVVAQRGGVGKFNFVLEGNSTRVKFEVLGDIKEWANFNKNDFVLSGTEEITVTLVVPKSVVEGLYNGRIVVVTPSNKNKTVEVAVDVTQKAVEVSKTFDLGDFYVSYSEGTDNLASKEDAEVSKSYFSEHTINLVHGSIDDDRFSIITSGFITLLIEDTNQAGNLIVEFNGKEVFNGKAVMGELNIPIEKSEIKKSNVVSIRAASPGWKFWMSTVYRMKNANFGINYQGGALVDKQFKLTSEETSKFRWGKLSFRVREYEQPNDLIIKINDWKIYRGVPSTWSTIIFGQEVALEEGFNNVSFSLDRDAKYYLVDVYLTMVRSV